MKEAAAVAVTSHYNAHLHFPASCLLEKLPLPLLIKNICRHCWSSRKLPLLLPAKKLPHSRHLPTQSQSDFASSSSTSTATPSSAEPDTIWRPPRRNAKHSCAQGQAHCGSAPYLARNPSLPVRLDERMMQERRSYEKLEDPCEAENFLRSIEAP